MLLSSCSKTPPVEAIENNLAVIQAAIEAKNNGDVMEHILDSFRGNEHLDKTNLRKLLAAHFLRHKNINVVVTTMQVEHNPKSPFYAYMHGLVAITGAEHLLPEDGRIFKVSGQWELHDGDWLLAKLDWQ